MNLCGLAEIVRFLLSLRKQDIPFFEKIKFYNHISLWKTSNKNSIYSSKGESWTMDNPSDWESHGNPDFEGSIY